MSSFFHADLNIDLKRCVKCNFFYLSLVISASQNRYKFVTAINTLHHLSKYAVHANVSHI